MIKHAAPIVMRGNSGDAKANAAVFSEMDKANKERIDLLNRKTRQIKEIALTIRDHLENESNNDLKQMSNSFAESNPMIGKLTRLGHREDRTDNLGLGLRNLRNSLRLGRVHSSLCVFFKVIRLRSPTNSTKSNWISANN